MPFPSITRPADRPELRYFFDPYCGWCYGFSPVIMRLYEELHATLDFVAHPGGMVVGERVGPLSRMADYIKSALPRLETVTGVAVGAPFRALLDAGTQVQDSEPPSRALTTLARLDGDPARTVPMAHALLTAFFANGHNINDPAVLARLAAPFGYPEATFTTALADPDTAGFTQAGFTAAGQLGITGFPTLVLRQGQQGTVLARGFAAYDQIRPLLDQVLAR